MTKYTTHTRKAVMDKDYAKLPLGKNACKGYALIDKAFCHLDKYKWTINGKGYVVANGATGMLSLHHLVLGKPTAGSVTDHINRNRLDNRMSNLRFVSTEVNAINKSMNRRNTSGYKGVTWHKNNKRWIAQMKFRGVNRFLGSFRTPEEAAAARFQAEIDHKVFKEALHA